MTSVQRLEKRVRQVEVWLTRFRLRYYIQGRPKRGCHRRHLKMVLYYLSLLETLAQAKEPKRQRGDYVEQRLI